MATILIIDDEKAVLGLLETVLTDAGHAVQTAQSGYPGFLILEKNFAVPKGPPIDLVIVDWMMPGWDGLRVLAEIRSRPYGGLPVALMSGAVTREQLEEAGRQHADAILVKPLDEAVVVAKITELLKKKR